MAYDDQKKVFNFRCPIFEIIKIGDPYLEAPIFQRHCSTRTFTSSLQYYSYKNALQEIVAKDRRAHTLHAPTPSQPPASGSTTLCSKDSVRACVHVRA